MHGTHVKLGGLPVSRDSYRKHSIYVRSEKVVVIDIQQNTRTAGFRRLEGRPETCFSNKSQRLPTLTWRIDGGTRSVSISRSDNDCRARMSRDEFLRKGIPASRGRGRTLQIDGTLSRHWRLPLLLLLVVVVVAAEEAFQSCTWYRLVRSLNLGRC